MKASLKAYMNTLKAETMPAFPQEDHGLLQRPTTSTWSELEAMVKEGHREVSAASRGAGSRRRRSTRPRSLDDGGKRATARSTTRPRRVVHAPSSTEPALNLRPGGGPARRMKEVAEKRDKEEANAGRRTSTTRYARLQSRLIYIDEYNYFLGDIRGRPPAGPRGRRSPAGGSASSRSCPRTKARQEPGQGDRPALEEDRRGAPQHALGAAGPARVAVRHGAGMAAVAGLIVRSVTSPQRQQGRSLFKSGIDP